VAYLECAKGGGAEGLGDFRPWDPIKGKAPVGGLGMKSPEADAFC